METLRLGATRVEMHDNGLTVTRFADGTYVPAVAHDTAEYLQRARDHGYGADVAAMSREHEVAHVLLAFVLDGGVSEALWRVAHGLPPGPHDDAEEAAVMSFQRLLRARGGSVIEIAGRLGAPASLLSQG